MLRLVVAVIAALSASCTVGKPIRGTGALFVPPSRNVGNAALAAHSDAAAPATIVHYRNVTPDSEGSTIAWYLFADGQLLSEIGNQGFFLHRVAPGPIRYETVAQVEGKRWQPLLFAAATKYKNARQPRRDAMTFEATPGGVYYFRWEQPRLEDGGPPTITRVDDGTAVSELADLREFPPVRAERMPSSQQRK